MKKELLLIVALVCLIVGGLSACSRQCPPCQTALGQPQYVSAQGASAPMQESAPVSRRSSIK